jgi:hypothetical protein
MNLYEGLRDQAILDVAFLLADRGQPNSPSDVALWVTAALFPELRTIEKVSECAEREIEILKRAEELLS